jgi:hypothetical protein
MVARSGHMVARAGTFRVIDTVRRQPWQHDVPMNITTNGARLTDHR